MKQTRFSLTLHYLRNSLLAVLTVVATTIPLVPDRAGLPSVKP